MIPQPTPEDLARDANLDYQTVDDLWPNRMAGTKDFVRGWIRRAVAAERDRDGYAAAFREVQRLACSMANRIEEQSQLLSKRAEKPPEPCEHHFTPKSWAGLTVTSFVCTICGLHEACQS